MKTRELRSNVKIYVLCGGRGEGDKRGRQNDIGKEGGREREGEMKRGKGENKGEEKGDSMR